MAMIRRATYQFGMMIRETGQALDRGGCALQGAYAYKEQLSRHRQVMNLMDSKPVIGKDVFIAPNATVIGDVILGDKASVWYGSVLRGDKGAVKVGEGSAIEDRAVVTGSVGIGALSRVGASSVLCGANELAAESLVEAGCVLRDSKVKKHAVLKAGSTLMNGEVPEGELWAGSPAVFVRKLTTAEITELIVAPNEELQVLATAHAQENGKTHEQIEAEILREELLRHRSDDYHSHLGVVGQEKELIETQARIVEESRKKQAAAGAA